MKVFIVVVSLVLLGVLGFVFLAWQSQQAPTLGVQQGHLLPCPDSPNCVCSGAADAEHAVPVWSASATQWDALPALIQRQGGVVQQQDPNYIHATFSSSWLHFVDDVEFRWDAASKQLWVRSASRVGRSDFGVNRQRVEALYAELKTL